MEFLIELLLGLLFEGSVEAAKSKKVPKGVRTVLICLISLAVVGLIGGTLALGVYLIVKRKGAFEVSLGALSVAIGAVMLFSAIRKGLEDVKKRKQRKEMLDKSEKGDEDGDHV